MKRMLIQSVLCVLFGQIVTLAILYALYMRPPHHADIPGIIVDRGAPESQQNWREYHLRKVLSEKDGIASDHTPEHRTALTSFGASVLDQVSQLPGVTRVLVYRYYIDVSKGRAFTWDELDAPILAILQGQHGEAHGPPHND